jgi:zinc transporter, ZIP family
MNQISRIAAADSTPVPARKSRAALLWLIVPLAALGLAIAWLLATNPLQGFSNGAPPVENLTFERTILSSDGIRVLVRAGGSEPMTIAQVQVDDAYWQFTQDPPGAISRGATAWIHLPFPWVLGEAHAINIVTNTGATFEHEISVAVPTPARDSTSLVPQAVLGLFVGLVPVAIGMMFYPALRGVGRAGMNFLLALTVGLLAFLLVDAAAEAFELAGESAALFQGQAMVWLAAAASFLLLMAAGRRRACRPGWRSPPSSRWGSACTTLARDWPSARLSRQARLGWAPSSSWASWSTISPRASAFPRRY